VRCKDNDGYGGPFIHIELAFSTVVCVGERLRHAIGNAHRWLVGVQIHSAALSSAS
jgi:hypothetical protein